MVLIAKRASDLSANKRRFYAEIKLAAKVNYRIIYKNVRLKIFNTKKNLILTPIQLL